MLTRYAGEQPMAEELLIAGIKPLPINRMLQQAGRKANQFYTKNRYTETNVPHPVYEDYKLEHFRPGTNVRDEKGMGRASQAQVDRKSRQNLADETMERLERAQEVINNWDPIEASAREDFNRLRGRRDPSAALDLIHTVDTPSNQGMSLGEMMIPRI